MWKDIMKYFWDKKSKFIRKDNLVSRNPNEELQYGMGVSCACLSVCLWSVNVSVSVYLCVWDLRVSVSFCLSVIFKCVCVFYVVVWMSIHVFKYLCVTLSILGHTKQALFHWVTAYSLISIFVVCNEVAMKLAPRCE